MEVTLILVDKQPEPTYTRCTFRNARSLAVVRWWWHKLCRYHNQIRDVEYINLYSTNVHDDVHQCMYVARILRTIGSGYEAKFGDEVRLVQFNA